MSNIWSQSGISRTAAGTMIGILATAGLAQHSLIADQALLNTTRVSSHEMSSTFGNFVSPTSGRYAVAERSFSVEVAEAYERFAASQCALEPEFEKILSENLWDLYAR